jgi:phytoene/squalene synthetase
VEKDVSKKWFMNLLEGRERIMTDAPFKTIAELEAYSDQTVTSILYLAFEMLGMK